MKWTALDGNMQKNSLDGHNKHRRNAGLSELQWDGGLGKNTNQTFQ